MEFEYVFGTNGNAQTLKMKGPFHSNLVGFLQLERKYPDQIITDHFRVVRKLKSDEDQDGNCYDCYEIDRHYRTTDKTGPLVQAEQRNSANIDYLSMMAGIDLPEEGEHESEI